MSSVPVQTSAFAESLARSLEGTLARFKHPRRYIRVEDLPRNAMSKVQKSELRATYADLFAD